MCKIIKLCNLELLFKNVQHNSVSKQHTRHAATLPAGAPRVGFQTLRALVLRARDTSTYHLIGFIPHSNTWSCRNAPPTHSQHKCQAAG